MTLEGWELLLDISPDLATINQFLDSQNNLLLAGADLLGRISISESEGAVLDALEVDGDTERGTKLIVTGVTLADRC